MPILAIFHCPAPRRLYILLEIRATLAQRLQRKGHLKLSTFFSIQMYGAHTNAYRSKLDLAVKGQMSMYYHHFSNFGRPPVPDDLCKVSAIRHPRLRRSRFLKFFTIYRHGGHLGQWTATSLAIITLPQGGSK